MMEIIMIPVALAIIFIIALALSYTNDEIYSATLDTYTQVPTPPTINIKDLYDSVKDIYSEIDLYNNMPQFRVGQPFVDNGGDHISNSN